MEPRPPWDLEATTTIPPPPPPPDASPLQTPQGREREKMKSERRGKVGRKIREGKEKE